MIGRAGGAGFGQVSPNPDAFFAFGLGLALVLDRWSVVSVERVRAPCSQCLKIVFTVSAPSPRRHDIKPLAGSFGRCPLFEPRLDGRAGIENTERGTSSEKLYLCILNDVQTKKNLAWIFDGPLKFGQGIDCHRLIQSVPRSPLACGK